jgi:hypothetical protein
MGRWAKLHSYTPTQPPKLPTLETDTGEAASFPAKAAILASTFFPRPAAGPPPRTARPPEQPGPVISNLVSPDEIRQALLQAAPWKAPGIDGLAIGFLRAVGQPLEEVLAILATKALQLGHHPAQLKAARVIVLPKPGKLPAAYKTAKGYRPIALLPCLSKVIEAIIANRLAIAAEEAGWLPQGQMGNRKGRSTETAIRLLTSQVQEAWRHKAVASLLQLDLQGAFDTIDHLWLLHTLAGKGAPGWLLNWLRSFLTGRTARLAFDGKEGEPIQILTGVPQGSPVSPILSIIFFATLYSKLEQQCPDISLIGFADDTNLVAFSRTATANIRQLTAAWTICAGWAAECGMAFSAEKSGLIHFTRAHRAPTEAIQLGQATIRPTEDARFLGVWVDRKLSWSAHTRHLKSRLATQKLAVSRLAAKTWGPSLPKTRQLYTAIVRSVIAYGASAFHKPTPAAGQPAGPARDLQTAQNSCLRVVTGAYRATPIPCLEVEAGIPPLDLYLN